MALFLDRVAALWLEATPSSQFMLEEKKASLMSVDHLVNLLENIKTWGGQYGAIPFFIREDVSALFLIIRNFFKIDLFRMAREDNLIKWKSCKNHQQERQKKRKIFENLFFKNTQ